MRDNKKKCLLVVPWANSEQGVFAYSYFASVSSAEEMMRIGIRFIGVVKTATKQIPMEYLSSIELNEVRCQRVWVVLKSNGAPTLLDVIRRIKYICNKQKSVPGLTSSDRNNIDDIITRVNEGQQEEMNPETETYDPYQIVVDGTNDDDDDDHDDNPNTTPGSAVIEEEDDTQSTGVAPENEDDEIPAPESPEE